MATRRRLSYGTAVPSSVAAAAPIEPPSPMGATGATAVTQGTADAEVMVGRSRIAPCVTCGLCGGFLRDAAAIADCLHPFCRECIVEEFTDKAINRCPKCDIDLGCNPLKKLRADHSLQRIRSLIFPAKRRKMEEISSLQPPFFPLPSPSNQTNEVNHPAKKADAHLMVEPTNAETETEADERLGTEPSSSLEKFIALSPHTAVISGVEPTWPDGCGNRQRDEQREEASSALSIVEPQGAIEGSGIEFQEFEYTTLEPQGAIEGSWIEFQEFELTIVEPQGAIEGSRIEEFESEHHGTLDKQAATQERNELTDEVDPWIVAAERSWTSMTTDEEWSTEGWMTTEWSRWTTAVTPSARRRTEMLETICDMDIMSSCMEVLGRQVAAEEQANANAAAKEAEARDRVRSLEDEVARLRRELEAARASASEADARRSVAEQKMMEAERAAEIMAHAFNRARDNLKEYGLLPVDPPPDWSVAEFAAGFGHVVADCLDRLRDAIADQIVDDVRDATTVTAEYVLACVLSRDPSFRMEMVLEGIVAADEVEEHALLGRARETALRFAREMVQVDMVPRAGGDGADGDGGSA